MSKLKELHDLVKDHIYRKTVDSRYINDYAGVMYKMFQEFQKEIKDHPNNDMFYFFLHEVFDLLWYYRNNKLDGDKIAAMEIAIGIIHRYIETGTIERLYTYYTGSNIMEGISRGTWYDLIDGKYKARMTLEEIEIYINRDKERLKKSNDSYWQKSYKESLEYYEKLKQEKLNE